MIAGIISIFMFTFIAGIASMVTAYLGLRSIPDDNESEASRKTLYFCIGGLLFTIIAFWLHSYIF